MLENFKKKIKVRIYLSLLANLILIALMIVYWTTIIRTSAVNDFASGFQFGILIGLIISSTLRIIYNIFLLRKESSLKREYIRCNDDREILIRQKSQSLTYYIAIFSVLIVAFIACFYNETVFLTLLGSLFFLEIIQIITYQIYRRIL